MATSITPAKVLPITKQLQDTLNGGTFYVRAVILNANTRETIDTVNLIDNGSGYFYYNWNVPALNDDVYIDILVTTYDDSGYTTINGMYGTEKFQYVIRDPRLAVGGGGGGADIDYKKVRQIIIEELAKITFPDIPETDLIPLFNRLSRLEQLIKENKPINPDYSGILSSISGVKDEIKKEIAKNKTEIDLSEINSKLDDYNSKTEKALKEIAKDFIGSVSKIPDYLKDFSKNIKLTAVFPVQLEKEQDKQVETEQEKEIKRVKEKYGV